MKKKFKDIDENCSRAIFLNGFQRQVAAAAAAAAAVVAVAAVAAVAVAVRDTL